MPTILEHAAEAVRKQLVKQLMAPPPETDRDEGPVVSRLLQNAQDRDAIMAGLAERVNADGGDIDSAARAILAESTYHSERHTSLYVDLLQTNGALDLGKIIGIAFFEAPAHCPIDCFRPLAEFALEIIDRRDSIGLREEMYENRNGCLKDTMFWVSMCVWDVEMTLGTDIDREALFNSQLEAEREMARTDPQNDPLRRILRFLLEHWVDIRTPHTVHSAMSSLMAATGCWDDTPQERIAFAQVCSACWKDYESRIGDHAA